MMCLVRGNKDRIIHSPSRLKSAGNCPFYPLCNAKFKKGQKQGQGSKGTRVRWRKIKKRNKYTKTERRRKQRRERVSGVKLVDLLVYLKNDSKYSLENL